MLRSILKDRYGEVRIPWRVTAGITLMGVCITAALFGAVSLGYTTTWQMGAAALCGELLASWGLTRLVNHKPLSAVGVGFGPNPAPDLVRGIVVGMAALGLASAILWLPGYVVFTWRPLSPVEVCMVAAAGLSAIILSAAAEELFFRGYVFQTLVQGVTLLPASLVMSSLFALAHIRNPGFLLLGGVNIGIAGLLFCIAYAKTGRLWLPLGIHTGWNYAQLIVCGYPTSGLLDSERMLCTATVSGPDWWTGGAFGPEGGLASTVALIACSWFVLKSQSFRRPAGLVTLDSVEDLIGTSKN